MNTYIYYFIKGLRTYCSGFPSDADLPDVYRSHFSAREWNNALRINYGTDIIEEKAVPLRSVFEFLRTDTTNTDPYGYFPLSLDEQHVFPVEEVGSFDNLITGFKEEWPKLRNLTSEVFGDTLLFLAKKYFSNAGFSPDYPHISLYEHLKTTSAIADSIERSQERSVLLVGAGLDDIQGFCYDIVSSKAAKSLKGRSFFLQMLLDTIAREILSDKQIKGTVGHIIYARGGKIFILLPDSDSVRSALDRIKAELNESIWERYRLSLFMFLKYQSFSGSDGKLSNVWQLLHEAIRIDKKQKNLLTLSSAFSNFFEPIEEGFNTADQAEDKQFCRVTGELIVNPIRASNNIETNPDEPPVWVHSSVKFQSELGEALRETKAYIQWKAHSSTKSVGSSPIFTGSRTWLSIPNSNSSWLGLNDQSLEANYSSHFLIKLNDLDFLNADAAGLGRGFAFYGGNEQALHPDGNRVKLFSELAGDEADEDGNNGFIRLGVGRMDVDGMSKVAAISESCFALNATFSSRLDLFLSGYVNTIRANNPEYVDYLNIVFSGGDDLLLIGRWDLVLDFLGEIRSEFRRFLGGDFLTMSAGLELITPKFPIAKAVELAGRGEDEAKKFNVDDPSTGIRPIADLPAKNALYFLGEAISWSREYDFINYLSERFAEWMDSQEKTGVSISLINKIYSFYELQRNGKPNWHWLSVWYFQSSVKDNMYSNAIFNCLKVFVVSGVWNLTEPDDVQHTYKFLPGRSLMLLSLGARIADFNKRNKG
jgi:CRISPR-associated protein Csm1